MTPPLTQKPEQAWLEQARSRILAGDDAGGGQLVSFALREYPHSFELRRMLAGIHARSGHAAEAESTLRNLLEERPDDAATAFALARMLVGKNRSAAAAATLREYFQAASSDPELAIQAIELLDDCGRKRDAAAIARQALEASRGDARLHAYAGMLAAQLGDFEQARNDYLRALELSPGVIEWHVPYGLASIQSYRDATHPDFARFRGYLAHGNPSDKARSTLLFALAKAHDDIGEYAQAAAYARQANSIACTLTRWPRKHWRRAIKARTGATPASVALSLPADFVPVFVVGVPRSGTTLVAELLARHPRVCNRGESPWLATLAQQPKLLGHPDRVALQRAADQYAAELSQDDAQGVRWFIDKQPLNFRYVDLAMTLFPNARVIHCQRNARDNALSLWLQSFLEDAQGYAYNFSDMALVMRDCERLMAHWRARYADSIRTVRYEQLVAAPEHVVADLVAWLGIPATAVDSPLPDTSMPISTASLWQARQPVHGRSVGRWRNYAPHVPELLQFAPD